MNSFRSTPSSYITNSGTKPVSDCTFSIWAIKAAKSEAEATVTPLPFPVSGSRTYNSSIANRKLRTIPASATTAGVDAYFCKRAMVATGNCDHVFFSRVNGLDPVEFTPLAGSVAPPFLSVAWEALLLNSEVPFSFSLTKFAELSAIAWNLDSALFATFLSPKRASSIRCMIPRTNETTNIPTKTLSIKNFKFLFMNYL